MRLGLNKKMSRLPIRLKRTQKNHMVNKYHLLDDLLIRTEFNLEEYKTVLNYCVKNNLDLLMHDDVVRHLNDREVYDHSDVLWGELKTKFAEVKKIITEANLRIYILTGMFCGLNSLDSGLRDKARMDIEMKSRLMHEIGGTGCIYTPATFAKLPAGDAYREMFESYRMIQNDYTNEYFHISNGRNVGSYIETKKYADKYKWKKVYHPTYDLARHHRGVLDFDQQYDVDCSNDADCIIFMPSVNKFPPKKKQVIDVGDFPKQYQQLNKTIIIDTHESDKSIDIIRG